MGMIDNLKLRISAALSPVQMTETRSKSKKKTWQTHMFGVEYNEDDLTLEDYQAMLKDSQVKSGIDLITMFLQSRDIIITPASEDPKDVEIAEFVEHTLDNMEYPMRKVRKDIYSALAYGYSVSEIIWKYEEKQNKMGIKKIKPLPIETIQNCFKYDDEGDVEAVMQDVGEGNPIEIEAEKCLIYTHDEQFGNRYGRSILNPVYDNWYQKMKIMEWWNVFLQKHEGPTLAGFVENPQYKDLMREQLEEVQEGRTQVTAGKEDRIEVIESSHRGEGFERAIAYHDNMIFRKMIIGTLVLGQSGGASGSYAQSQTHLNTLSVFLDGIHEDVAGELEIKIKQLVDYNFETENYPDISFESFEEKDVIKLMEVLTPYIDKMVIDTDEPWLQQLIADVVAKFSNVKVPVDKEPNGESKKQEVNIPTEEEQKEELPEEHKELLTNITDMFPGQEG